ncbi:MAG: FAD-dependent monooxygenase [Pseudomonadota bacterium]
MDHLVIGGGPAGSMLACGLARRGRDVLVLERSSGAHHKICGEFLSWEAARILNRSGFDLAALDGAPIDRLRIVDGPRHAETRLPGTATGISRYRLDEALLAHAATAGAQVERGATVSALTPQGARLSDGDLRKGARIWLATGKRDLRGHARDVDRPGITTGLVGFKWHLTLAPADAEALARTIELTRFSGGYAGIQPIEDGKATLCLLIERCRAAGGWPAVLAHMRSAAPALHARFVRSVPIGDRPLAIARVPYGYRRRDGLRNPFVAIGDQRAVIHSFTGDGMALALAGGLTAAAGVDDAPTLLDRRLGRLVAGPVARAARGYRLLSGGGLAVGAVMRVPALAGLVARLTRVRLGHDTTVAFPQH